jgi:hypothetical protein
MDKERSSLITIGGKEYRLILTTKATKEIAKRYGGLENLGEKLMKAENFEMALEEIVWLIALLANQSILINNRLNGEKEELLTLAEHQLIP